MHKFKNDNKKFFRGNNSNGRNFIDRKSSFILAFGFIISALILGYFLFRQNPSSILEWLAKV